MCTGEGSQVEYKRKLWGLTPVPVFIQVLVKLVFTGNQVVVSILLPLSINKYLTKPIPVGLEVVAYDTDLLKEDIY